MPAHSDVVEMTMRRTLLRLRPSTSALQDYVDAAAQARALGLTEAETLLRAVFFLRTGGDRPLPESRAIAAAAAIDAAIAELTSLIVATDGGGSTAAVIGSIEAPTLKGLCTFSKKIAWILGRCGVAAEDLCAEALQAIAPEACAWPYFDPSLHVNSPIMDLARMVAFDAFKHFWSVEGTLARVPLGSPELFIAAARLRGDLLGAYFSNLPRLIRSVADIPAMVRLAAPKMAEEDVQRWIVRIVMPLPMASWGGLGKLLARLGYHEALTNLLTIASTRSEAIDTPFLWDVRDGALISGCGRIAAASQRLIASRRPNEATEWTILGQILVVWGDLEAAEEAFSWIEKIAPGNEDARRWRTAIRQGDHLQLSREHGFFADPARKGWLAIRQVAPA